MVEINTPPPFPNPDEKIIRVVKFVQYEQRPSGCKFWRMEFRVPEGEGHNLRAFDNLPECIDDFLEDFKE